MAEKLLFNEGWLFKLDNSEWQTVELPHDWLIYDTENLYKNGVGQYHKWFPVCAGDLKEKRFFLRFDGVYMDSTVLINYRPAFEWKYGYSMFEFEITDYLIEGANEILVCVNYQSPNSRWYSGAGIYRDVWLKTAQKGKPRIVSDGIYITPKKQDDENWVVEVDTELENETDKTSFRYTVTDSSGYSASISCPLPFNEFDKGGEIPIISPKLWDIDSPALYTLKTELLEDGKVIETEENKFGLRTVQFTPNEGIWLNGRNIKLNGVCQHHDLGCLGSAVNRTALKRQLGLLQEMGVNAIRTAHNMPARVFMELCDEMGILVISEAFDMWENSKTKYDYARFFPEWVERDVASWIRRDRNSPSVIMWSIGNEIGDTNGERGLEVTKMLARLVVLNDLNNHAPVTIGSNYMEWEGAQKCADVIKFAGYNYAERLYHKHHEKYPDWFIYGSETSSVVQSRGVYHFPLKQPLLSDDDEQCSALGNSSVSWGAKNTERCIIDDRDAKFSMGTFLWTGTDYIGEPTPYHTKNSYFGQIDTAGFKKDSFYMYQAEWTDYKIKPMVHIIPSYWDFSPGQIIDVRVCSNAPKIELFFNDESLGVFDIDHANGQKLFGEWQVAYKSGALRAVAYNENNNIVAEDIRRSFGDAAEIILTPDKTEMTADGLDLIFVEISANDKNGVPAGNANNRINIEVSGAGRLVGLDNGDSTDFEQYKNTASRKLFSGKLLAVIGSLKSAGEITLTATSKGLKSKTVKFAAVYDEIPIRKIELICDNIRELSDAVPKVKVEAKIYPADATYDYSDLEWRAANAAGVDSNLVTVTPDATGKSAVLEALGDGEFYLRCSAKNGGDKIRLISQLEFTVKNMGNVFIDPYKFVSGGLYNASNIELTNGNDRGVATDRVVESHVGFRHIDFGSYGSDEVTIPIFSLSGGEFQIDFWEGMPGEEGSRFLCTHTYTQGSRWNTYLEQTFKLPYRLKGVTDFCVVARQKIHIKGFMFTKFEKAFEQLNAAEFTNIYGDSFKITGNSIEEIGNNVSIKFDDMDFGKGGFLRLQICGRTPLEKNTIQVKFSGEEQPQIIEFVKSDEYITREFYLENATGKQSVTFLFLPGCRFDFKWFRFI
jgi:beta-galactosidase